MMEYYETSDEEENSSQKSHGPVMKFSYLYPSKTTAQVYNKNRSSYSSDDYKSLSRQSSSDVDNHYYSIGSTHNYSGHTWSPGANSRNSTLSVTEEDDVIYQNVQGLSYNKAYTETSGHYVDTPPKTNFSPHIKGMHYSDKPIMFSERTYEERQEERRRKNELKQYREEGFKDAHLYYVNADTSRSTSSPVNSSYTMRQKENTGTVNYRNQKYLNSNFSSAENTKSKTPKTSTENVRTDNIVKLKNDYNAKQNKMVTTNTKNYESKISSYKSSSSVGAKTNNSARKNLQTSSPAVTLRRTSPSPAARSRQYLSPTGYEKQRISPIEFNARRSRFEQYSDSLNAMGTSFMPDEENLSHQQVAADPSQRYGSVPTRTSNSYEYASQCSTSSATNNKSSAFSPVLTNGSLGRSFQTSNMANRNSSPMQYKSQEELIKTASEQYQEYLRKQEQKTQVIKTVSSSVTTTNGSRSRSPAFRRNISPVPRKPADKRSSSVDDYSQGNAKYGRSVSSMVKKYETVAEQELASWNDYMDNFYGMKYSASVGRNARFASQQNLHQQQSSVGCGKDNKSSSSSALNSYKQTGFYTSETTLKSNSYANSSRTNVASPGTSMLSTPGYLSPSCVQSVESGIKGSSYKQSSSQSYNDGTYRSTSSYQESDSNLPPQQDIGWVYVVPEKQDNSNDQHSHRKYDNFYGNQNVLMNTESEKSERKILGECNTYRAVSPRIPPSPRFGSSYSTSISNNIKTYGSSTILDKSSERKSDQNTSRFSTSNQKIRSQSVETTNTRKKPNRPNPREFYSDGRPRTRVVSPPPPPHFTKITTEAMKKTQSYDVNPDQRLLNLLFGRGEEDQTQYDSHLTQKKEVVEQSKFIREIPKSIPKRQMKSESDMSVTSQNSSFRNSPVNFRGSQSTNQINNSSSYYSSQLSSSQQRNITSPVNLVGTSKSYLAGKENRSSISSPINYGSTSPYRKHEESFQSSCIKSEGTSTMQNYEFGTYYPSPEVSDNRSFINKKDKIITSGTNVDTSWTRCESPSTYVARTYYVANSQMPKMNEQTSYQNSYSYGGKENQMSSTMDRKSTLYKEFSCTSPSNVLRESKISQSSMNSSYIDQKRSVSVKSPTNYSGYSYSQNNSGNSVINMQTLSGKTSSDAGGSVLKFVVDTKNGMSDIEERKRRYLMSVEHDKYFPLRSDIVTPPPSYYSGDH